MKAGLASVRIVRHSKPAREKRRPDNRPAGLRPFELPKGVDPDSLPAVVARNVHTLLSVHPSIKSQLALAKAAGIGQATVDRIFGCVPGVRIDSIEKIAKAFDPELMTWMLLLPKLDPANLPVVSLTRTERDLYERLTTVAKQVTEHHEQRGAQANNRPDRVPGGNR